MGFFIDEVVKSDTGVQVDFLGAPTYISRAPSSLSNKTGAAILPVTMRLTESGDYQIQIHPEIERGDDRHNTQPVMDVFGKLIAEEPWQWLQWLRRWKLDAQARWVR